MLKSFCILIVLILFSFSCFGQQLILKNIKNDKQIELPVGVRVGYLTNSKKVLQTGIITSFSENEIVLDSIPYNHSDIASICPRKKGTTIKLLAGSIVTAALIGSSINPSVSNPLQIIGIGSSLALFTYLETIAIKTQPKKLKKKWRLVYTP